MAEGAWTILGVTVVAVVALILACRYFDGRGCVDEPYSRDEDYGERL